jgi:predicted negative regulator of RcsB-dependent stress response
MSYHDEQETLESVKAWWERWGNATTWILLVAVVAAAAWNGWNYWQRHQAAEAAVLYDRLQQATAAGDKADKATVTRVATDMEDKFGGTAYAQMTALAAAKALYQAGDEPGAKAQLQWAADHAKDAEFKQIAKLRLASLLLDEKAYDAGLALVEQPESDAFKGVVADSRGDLLAAQGKRDDARAAYKVALDALPKNDISTRQLIQFKLDALGG